MMRPKCASASPDRYSILEANAKSLRLNMTVAEFLLWQELRNSQLGARFRRQHVIGDYIVDFVCLSKRLVIEVDGKYHSIPQQVKEDEARTEALSRMGFRVVRFTNNQVCNHLEEVIETIMQQIA